MVLGLEGLPPNVIASIPGIIGASLIVGFVIFLIYTLIWFGLKKIFRLLFRRKKKSSINIPLEEAGVISQRIQPLLMPTLVSSKGVKTNRNIIYDKDNKIFDSTFELMDAETQERFLTQLNKQEVK